MNNEEVELVFILDRSGSMSSMQAEAIGGFNAFLEEQKKLPGSAKLTLVLFDHEYNLLYNGKNLKDVEPLTDKTYEPRGTTALLDAVGRTLNDVGNRINNDCKACGAKAGKVLVAVLTDGLENASQDYKKSKINEMIEHHKKQHDWQFIFLAANQDAFKEGLELGVDMSKSANYTMDAAGFTKGFNTINTSTSVYRNVARETFASVDINSLVDDNGNETQFAKDLMTQGVDLKNKK